MPASATETGEAAVRAAFADQARWCEGLGSPFTALLCRLFAARLDRSTEIGRRVLDWPGRPDSRHDAVPLRLCGGLHALVRGGKAPGLAALYPPAPLPEEEALWRALRETLGDPRLLRWLESPPQTNEVGRSALLMSGLLALAARHPGPMALLELGASAGLNLNLDLYAYRLGGLEAGAAGSGLRLEPEWEGPAPPAAEVRIAARRGVDLEPVDAVREGARLLAYVWPDQPARLARIAAALEIAARHPVEVARGDAAGWLEARLAEAPSPGATRVVLHSVAWQYFPAEAQARCEAALAAAAAAASEAQPLAWLRFELRPGEEAHSLRLRSWPGGEERLLAWGQAHGRRVRWVG